MWNKIKNEDIAKLNSDLTKSGPPAIDPTKPPASAPESDDDGDDVP
jgi:hypothetical protein